MCVWDCFVGCVLQVSYCLGGVFELRLSAFSNPSGRDMDGNCCVQNYNNNNNLRSGSTNSMMSNSGSGGSSGGLTTPSDSNMCGGLCTTKFRVCVKHYQVTIDHNPPCTFGEASTTDMYTDHPINQEFKFPFNFRWPVRLFLFSSSLSLYPYFLWPHNS